MSLQHTLPGPTDTGTFIRHTPSACHRAIDQWLVSTRTLVIDCRFLRVGPLFKARGQLDKLRPITGKLHFPDTELKSTIGAFGH